MKKINLSCIGLVLISLACLTLSLFEPTPVKALTINSIFIPPGETFPEDVPILGGVTADSQPSNAVGGGNLESIFAAAANYWENIYLDNHTINLYFAWLELDPFLGPEFLGAGYTFDTTFPATTGVVVFDSTSSSDLDPLFLDPTPLNNEEYRTYTETLENLGAGELTVGRVYSNAVGSADGTFDLLTLALHEIVHSMGFQVPDEDFGLPGNPSYTFPTLTIAPPLPFAGTVIPTTFPEVEGAHIDIPTSIFYFRQFPGERQLPSAADILGIAQVVGFTEINPQSLERTPEPSSLLGIFTVLFLGLGTLKASKQ